MDDEVRVVFHCHTENTQTDNRYYGDTMDMRVLPTAKLPGREVGDIDGPMQLFLSQFEMISGNN